MANAPPLAAIATPPRNDASLTSTPSSRLSASRRATAPVFDPHGLFASAHSDDDAEETAAQGTAEGDGKAAAGIAIVSGEATTQDATSRFGRRGRRRRSSEFVHDDTDQLRTDPTYDPSTFRESTPGGTPAPFTPSVQLTKPAKLWWQRSEDGERDETQGKGVAQARAKPKVDIEHLGAARRLRQASDDTAGSSPSVRSPAAAFLSNMNDMLSSPVMNSPIGTSIPSRGYSLSPVRTDDPCRHFASASDGTGSVRHASDGARTHTAGQFGLAGAAAQLYNTVQDGPTLHSISSYTSNHNRLLKPDDEGARIGPDGRYLLGGAIGHGGFSIVREAWDMGGNVSDTSVGADEAKDWHRVAVKIVYSKDNKEEGKEADVADGTALDKNNELELWSSIPAHPNILPLLYHERIHVTDRVTKAVSADTIDFLVMPFCECNLLTFVRNGGTQVGVKTASSSRNGSVSGASLERRTSLHGQRDTSLPPSTASSSAETMSGLFPASMRAHRTGSGFLPHTHRHPGAGDRATTTTTTTTTLSAFLNRSASVAAIPMSQQVSPQSATASQGSVLRRSSLRVRAAQAPSSNGLPIALARNIIHQVADAVLCLHHKSGILHGDLKLENILGQYSQAQQARPRSGADVNDGGVQRASEPFAADPALICWRLADFGLAHKVASKVEVSHDAGLHARWGSSTTGLHRDGAAMFANMMRRHSSSGYNSLQTRSQGGSLAYAAPEAFVVPDTDDEEEAASQYATDMWAMGCIIYALFAGRLPFTDAFEPRLQSKIAQGRWEMPERLHRRGRKHRKQDAKDESVSSNRANSFGAYAHGRRQTVFASGFTAMTPTTAPVQSESCDMSASMPALPARLDGNASMTGLPSSSSNQSIVMADDGSTTMDNSIISTWDDDGGEDPLSDSDETIDVEMDGTSKDRAAVRTILRGLLEVDSKKRWTIRQLVAMDWLSAREPKAAARAEELALDSLAVPTSDGDLPSSLRDEILGRRRGSETMNLAHTATIYETSTPVDEAEETDVVGPMDSTSEVEGSDDVDNDRIGRSRAPRRDRVGAPTTQRAQPIDIDRSKSRSRSRARDDDVPSWNIDAPQGGGFNWRQQQLEQQQQHHRQSPVNEYRHDHFQAFADRPRSRSRLPRSTSVDAHNPAQQQRGRTKNDRTSDGARGTSSSRGRTGSRSTSRSRRADLDLIMPQLALHRSGGGGSEFGAAMSADEPGSRDGSPAPAAALRDDYTAARSSTWKSPMRARDRLSSLMSGSGAHAGATASASGSRSSSISSSVRREQNGEQSRELRNTRDSPAASSKDAVADEDDKQPWWDRGRSSRPADESS